MPSCLASVLRIIVSMTFQVNLVVPGPEQPLVDGIEAVFRKGAAQAIDK